MIQNTHDPKIVIALDYANAKEALNFVEQLDPTLCRLKVGKELFTAAGPQLVEALVAKGFGVFLDLKFHDIPNTVARACKASADLGVWMLNVHASGGLPMMLAAREALLSYGKSRPLLIAVTVLTSMNAAELRATGIHEPLEQRVCALARLAKDAALDGVVSSAHEVPAIKAACGHDFITVTPGIRLASENPDDQARIITPELAIKAGSDYLVVGRPITQASSPAQVVSNLLTMIE